MRTGQHGSDKSGARRRPTLFHLLVRLCVMLAALTAIDAGIGAYQHNHHHYDADWRLPTTMPMAGLPGYVDHIVGLGRDEQRQPPHLPGGLWPHGARRRRGRPRL
jgi:hypothetical protein